MSDESQQPHGLSLADVHKVARLARLNLTPEQADLYRLQLSVVLEYVENLADLDLSGVEPMASPLDMGSPLGADEPGPVLANSDLMAIAPDRHEPFIRVPKVIGGAAGEGGGA